MDIEEIRVGNFITSKGYLALCWKVLASDIEKMHGDMDYYIPLELNEKWILNLGFIKNDTDLFSIEINGNCIELIFKGDGYNLEIGGIKIFFVKYVHSLQNILFDLKINN